MEDFLKFVANKFNGRNYGDEITMDECNEFRELGIVVVFGYSDDNTEFRGAIHNEVGTYEGGEIFLNSDGLFEDCECECKWSVLEKLKCKSINALWCEQDHIPWTYDTDIPHETFNVLEDGEIYCRGIVFNINKLCKGIGDR